MATKNNIILDASVVIKWFAKEDDSDKAITYLEAFQNNEIGVIIPTLLFYELGNVLINKKVTIPMAEDIIYRLKNLHIDLIDAGFKSFQKIYQNAIEFSITFYDSAYVTLMKEENCKFITADKKLYQKIKSHFPLSQLL